MEKLDQVPVSSVHYQLNKYLINEVVNGAGAATLKAGILQRCRVYAPEYVDGRETNPKRR